MPPMTEPTTAALVPSVRRRQVIYCSNSACFCAFVSDAVSVPARARKASKSLRNRPGETPAAPPVVCCRRGCRPGRDDGRRHGVGPGRELAGRRLARGRDHGRDGSLWRGRWCGQRAGRRRTDGRRAGGRRTDGRLGRRGVRARRRGGGLRGRDGVRGGLAIGASRAAAEADALRAIMPGFAAHGVQGTPSQWDDSRSNDSQPARTMAATISPEASAGTRRRRTGGAEGVLRRAVLRRAVLRRAVLRRAVLRRAVLRRAALGRAALGRAVLGGRCWGGRCWAGGAAAASIAASGAMRGRRSAAVTSGVAADGGADGEQPGERTGEGR